MDPICINDPWAHTQAGVTDQGQAFVEMHVALLEHECRDMWSAEASLHGAERHEPLERWYGDCRDSLGQAVENFGKVLGGGTQGDAKMRTPLEKMKEQLTRVIDCWQVEFDIDNYSIIGVVEDIKHGLIWGGTPLDADQHIEEEGDDD